MAFTWMVLFFLVIVGISLATAVGIAALIFWLVKKGHQPDKSSSK